MSTNTRVLVESSRIPSVFFADEGRTTIKIGDFGLAMYRQPGEKFSSGEGVSTPSSIQQYLAHAFSRRGRIKLPKS
jgi:hypothetical protein